MAYVTAYVTQCKRGCTKRCTAKQAVKKKLTNFFPQHPKKIQPPEYRHAKTSSFTSSYILMMPAVQDMFLDYFSSLSLIFNAQCDRDNAESWSLFKKKLYFGIFLGHKLLMSKICDFIS